VENVDAKPVALRLVPLALPGESSLAGSRTGAAARIYIVQ